MDAILKRCRRRKTSVRHRKSGDGRRVPVESDDRRTATDLQRENVFLLRTFRLARLTVRNGVVLLVDRRVVRIGDQIRRFDQVGFAGGRGRRIVRAALIGIIVLFVLDSFFLVGRWCPSRG